MKNTKWYKWNDRNRIKDKNQPAIYYIAYSKNNISNKKFKYVREIIYIGMTISNLGLKGRLDQFENAMKGKDGGHGGAQRVRFKYNNYDKFLKNAYLSARIFKLSKNRNTANDWRIKGACVCHEYKSFAEYLDIYGNLPEFNDQKKSKKK